MLELQNYELEINYFMHINFNEKHVQKPNVENTTRICFDFVKRYFNKSTFYIGSYNLLRFIPRVYYMMKSQFLGKQNI